MDIQLKITLVYSSGNPDLKRLFEELASQFELNAQIRVLEYKDFESDGGEYLVISSDLCGEIQEESYSFWRDGELYTYDNGEVYPCSSLEFTVRKYFEIKQYQQELKDVSSLLTDEIARLQDFYRSKVPSSSQVISGLKITSKFKTGNQPGGDFFDVIETSKSIQILMCSVDSYLLNSQFIEKVLNYKEVGNLDIREFTTGAIELKKHFSDSKMDLLVLEIKKDDRTIQGYQFGGADVFLAEQKSIVYANQLKLESDVLEQAFFRGSLDQGANLVISSSGTIENWKELGDIRDYYDMLRLSEKPQQTLESVIIRLYEENCIKYDISMIWIEVNKYDIRKV